MARARTYAHVDANSFFVSCELDFRPDLVGRPVVVLSPHDATVVARNDAAKALGITMNQRFEELRLQLVAGTVIAFSANFVLYADKSCRLMDTLRQFSPACEVYSIDEAWLDITDVADDLAAYAEDIQQTVRQWIGIPVSVGLGSTKTLAKVANGLARRWPDEHTATGVLDLRDPRSVANALAGMAVDDIWGIGSKYRDRLADAGILTAQQLTKTADWWIRKRLGVKGLWTVMELRGHACLPFVRVPPARKTFTTAPVFATPTERLEIVRQALTNYTVRTVARLRRNRLAALGLSVFLTVSSTEDPAVHTLFTPTPTDDYHTLVWMAQQALSVIFRPGLWYSSVGIMVHQLVPARYTSDDFFHRNDPRLARISTVMDETNARYGRGTIRLGGEGVTRPWEPRPMYKSPNYTTDPQQLLRVRA